MLHGNAYALAIGIGLLARFVQPWCIAITKILQIKERISNTSDQSTATNNARMSARALGVRERALSMHGREQVPYERLCVRLPATVRNMQSQGLSATRNTIKNA